MLDNDNPGVVVKVGGSQRVQLAFKVVPKDVACDSAVRWAKAMAAKKMNKEDARDYAREKKAILEAEMDAAVMKKPAGKKPSAATNDEPDDEAGAHEDEEEEAEEEEATEEDDAADKTDSK